MIRRKRHINRASVHTSISTYINSVVDKCPDIVGENRIASHEADLCGKTNPTIRRQIYCGLDDNESEADAPHICLKEDEKVTEIAGAMFDVDSIVGFPGDLAVTKQGIRWYPTQMPVSDLQSSIRWTFCKKIGRAAMQMVRA